MEFNSFQSRMAEETQRAKENAERLANEKKDLNDKIRTLKQSLAIQKNENSKAEDEVTNARHTKEFLDKIAPLTWLKSKRELTYNYWKGLQTDDVKRAFDSKVRDFMEKQGRGMPYDEALLFVFERDHYKEELVENYDLEYEMYFSDTDQLIKKLSKLEEDNLALMNAQQEIEDRLNEEKDKLQKMEMRKKEVESDAKQRKEQLAKAVQIKIQQTEELREGTKESKKNNTEDSFLAIGNLIKRMLEEFKDLMKDQKYHDIGQIDADDPKNKENILKYLKTIERLLIDQITGLREQISQNQLNLKKDKDRRKQNDNKLEEEVRNREVARQYEEKEKRLEERNQARPTRKDMFKTTQGEKKVAVKPNNDQEEENLNRKYFRT